MKSVYEPIEHMKTFGLNRALIYRIHAQKYPSVVAVPSLTCSTLSTMLLLQMLLA